MNDCPNCAASGICPACAGNGLVLAPQEVGVCSTCQGSGRTGLAWCQGCDGSGGRRVHELLVACDECIGDGACIACAGGPS